MEVSMAYWETEQSSLDITLTSDLSLHDHKRQPAAPTTSGPRINSMVQNLLFLSLTQSPTSLALVTFPLQVF